MPNALCGPSWSKYSTSSKRTTRTLDLQQTQRFNYLYQRVLSDLARIVTFSSEPEIRRYLESLTARAYGEMNENRDKSLRFTPFKWFAVNFPQVFRKHLAYFWLSLGMFLLGCAFGAGMLAVDPGVKTILIPAVFRPPLSNTHGAREAGGGTSGDISVAGHSSSRQS